MCFTRTRKRVIHPQSFSTEALESRLLLAAGPTLLGIELAPNTPPVISANQVTFTVTFSDLVTGVSAEDFRVMGDGVTSTGVTVTGSGSIYDVTVNGIVGSGSLSILLFDDRTIRDVEGQPLNLMAAPAILGGRFDVITSAAPESVTLSDVNGDRLPDLIVPSGDTVGVLLGKPNSTVQPRQDFQTGSGARTVAVEDINEDGQADLVVACLNSNVVSVLLGNGDGTFQSHQDLATGVGPNDVVLKDLNRDQHLDLVVTHSGSDSIGVLFGKGNATFGPRMDLVTGQNPVSVAAGDVNGDGITDLAVANLGLGSVSIQLGAGDGTFRTGPAINPNPGASAVALGDLNGDGRADLVVCSQDNNRLSTLLGNGDGSFQKRSDFATGSHPREFQLADLNGDGRLDVAVTNQFSGAVSVLLGNGNGRLQSKQDFKTGQSSIGLAIGDVNQDGSPDVAVSNRDSANVSVWLGFGNMNGQVVNVDQTGPVLTITSTVPNPTATSPIPVTIRSSKPITDLTASDVIVSGGTVSGFSGSGNTYSLQVTPSGPGPVILDIPANSTHDLLGNPNRQVTFSRSFGTATIAPLARNGRLATVAGSSMAGTLTVEDEDSPAASLTISVVSPPLHGVVRIDDARTGAYTYTPAAGYDGPDSFTFHAHDGTQFGNTATVSITIAKRNTPASISGTSTGMLTEDALISVASGQMIVTDPDTNENVFQSPGSLTGRYGTFTFNPLTGDWTYTLDNARTETNQLLPDQQVTDNIEVVSFDGTAKSQIIITISGSDDPPRIGLATVPLAFKIGSGRPIPLDATATITDPEGATLDFTGATLRVSGIKSKDSLAITKQGSISLNGKNILFGQTVMGTFSGGTKGKSLTIKFKPAATPEAVQALLRAITFNSTDKNVGTRNLSLQFTAIGGQDSNVATRSISLAK